MPEVLVQSVFERDKLSKLLETMAQKAMMTPRPRIISWPWLKVPGRGWRRPADVPQGRSTRERPGEQRPEAPAGASHPALDHGAEPQRRAPAQSHGAELSTKAAM